MVVIFALTADDVGFSVTSELIYKTKHGVLQPTGKLTVCKEISVQN